MLINLKVTNKFQDKYTKEVYLPGASIATEEIDRTNDLVKRGLCEIASIEVAEENADNSGANDGAEDGGENDGKKTKKGK